MSLRDNVLASVDAYRRPDGSINVTALAGHIGLRRTSLQRVLKSLGREGRLGTKPVIPGFGIKETSTNGKVTWVKQAPLGDKFEMPDGLKLHWRDRHSLQTRTTMSNKNG